MTIVVCSSETTIAIAVIFTAYFIADYQRQSEGKIVGNISKLKYLAELKLNYCMPHLLVFRGENKHPDKI